MPQLWSCSFTPVNALTIQLNTREGNTLCQGSCRTFFQPLKTSRFFSISARKSRDFVGIVLEVGVEGHHQFAARLGKARTQGRGLAKVAAEPQTRDPRVGCRQTADLVPRAVGRTVVDQHHVQVVALGSGHLGQLAVQSRQAFDFVEDGDDDGEHGQASWEGVRD